MSGSVLTLLYRSSASGHVRDVNAEGVEERLRTEERAREGGEEVEEEVGRENKKMKREEDEERERG